MTTRNVPEHLNQSHDGKSKGERHLLMEQDVNVSHALCYKLSFGHIFILTIKNIYYICTTNKAKYTNVTTECFRTFIN